MKFRPSNEMESCSAGVVLFGGIVALLVCAATPVIADETLDLSRAVIVVASPGNPVLDKAAALLEDEVLKRTGVKLERAIAPPSDETAAVVLAVGAAPSEWGVAKSGPTVPDKADAYAVWVDTAKRRAPAVYLVGHDERGALFAAGRLLRLLEMRAGQIALTSDTRIASTPHDRIRGHHFGYDDANNTYDAWTVPQFEQYLRDLIVFGISSVELSPNFEGVSPHMVTSSERMNVDWAKVIVSYGLDVWIFHALHGDVSDPELAERELERSAYEFQKFPHIDAVFVPGGDPGETPPQTLMPFLAKLSSLLQQYHPGAELWLSNQAFEDTENDYLFDYLATEKPDWLTGMIFGPWAKITMRELRERTPVDYRVRSYPDITHSVRCQYPVPNWDRALAHSLGRECANPRPRAHAHIHSAEIPYSEGSIPYSEGVNDDVNKIVWLARSWDPNVDVADVMREYGRYFIGEELGPAVGEGLLAQEKNWEGPLLGNATVQSTFAHWQAIESKSAADELKNNWRLQQGLIRAYYDAYIQQRLAVAVKREEAALAELRKAPEVGVAVAIAAAREALEPADAEPVAPELRSRIEALGAALFRTIGAQLDVERYGAARGERGAILEFLDQPLNDAPWLEAQFDEILREQDSATQLERVAMLANWENAGPGNFYDDLGNATKQPHLVRGKPWADDPGFVDSPQDEFSMSPNPPLPTMRLSWLDQAQTLFRSPLDMRYEGLDPDATYMLRVTYAGRFKAKMTLTANGAYVIHGPAGAVDPIAPQEFSIPREATRGGTLELRWEKTEGRGCQVAEVWLLRN